MKEILAISQIIVSVLLIVFILLQQRGTALGGAFGQGGGGEFYASRRGMQKTIYWLTIIFTFLFIILAVLNLFLR